MSVSYSSGDTVVHIGSKVTVSMVVVSNTQTFNVSVTAATAGTLTLGSADFGSLFAPTQLYVTDGQRVWGVVHPGGATSTITMGNGNLISGAPTNWQVTAYTSLANQSFRVYSGSLVNQLSGGTKVLYTDLGSFAKIELFDDGNLGLHGDPGSNDGIWSGIYNVQDLGFLLTGTRFYGVAGVNGVFATNQPFQSPQTIDIDALRPAIETFQFTTNKSNYNGVLYISSLSQGTPTFQSTNAQGRFDFTVNKRGAVVGIEIVIGGGNKTLPPVTISPSASNRNGWNTWDGTNGAGNYVADGSYTVNISIQDLNGVSGAVKTTQVRVSSLLMEIGNITLSPSSLQTEPKIVNGVITRVDYKVILRNESNSDIRSALNAIGWNPATFNDLGNHLSWAYHLPEIDFLKPDGSVGIAFPGLDNNPDYDSDYSWLFRFNQDTSLHRFPNCYFPTIPAPNAMYITGSGRASVADGDKTNDMELIFPFNIVAGTNINPTRMEANPSLVFLGNTPTEGSYRLRLRSLLSSLEAFDVTPPLTAPDTSDFCAGTADLIFFSRRWHFAASARPQGAATSTRGFGFNVEDASVLFSVSKNQPLTSDTTAPVVITSDPLSGSEVEPSAYSSSRPLSVQVQDSESAIAINAGQTNLRLFYINAVGARVPIGGEGNPDGGNPSNQVNLYFKPNVPVTQGGSYILQANACNVNGLCISQEIPFSVQDRAAPTVTGVELVLSTQLVPVNLTLQPSSPDGPYDNVAEIRATLAMPAGSSNTIDWGASNISLLRNLSGTTNVVSTVRLSSLTTAPSDGKLRYRLTQNIDYAGSFEVVVQTFANNASGNAFSGPEASFINPKFTTQVNSNVYKVYYPGPSDGTYEAITGLRPLTITSNSVWVTPTSLTALLPNYSALPAASGYQPLTATAGSAHGLRFTVVGSGLVNNPLRFDYPGANPVRFKLYYNDSDLTPLGVSKTALTLLGYTGSAWQQVSAVTHDSTSGTRNSFTLDAPLSADTYVAYGIFYSVPATGPGALPTATAVVYRNSRSFNPVHRNPVYRKARLYYSDRQPREVDVRIYDSNGTLVRAMALGSGINLTDLASDPTNGTAQYFYEWDGRNDSGTLVRNGLYLARCKVVRLDGSVETMVKPLALIK